MITLKAISLLLISALSFSWWINEEHRPKIYFFFESKEEAMQRENDPALLFILRTGVLAIAFTFGCFMMILLTKYLMERARYSYPVDF